MFDVTIDFGVGIEMANVMCLETFFLLLKHPFQGNVLFDTRPKYFDAFRLIRPEIGNSLRNIPTSLCLRQHVSRCSVVLNSVFGVRLTNSLWLLYTGKTILFISS
ncbi:hypothetical protein AMECASPLE_033246 [Ameca splendens]|uniref:Uncharacterized protein n=1 Tax=Ameca splendens TaxID=208324 RepID=A0ABV0XVS8_9TELE